MIQFFTVHSHIALSIIVWTYVLIFVRKDLERLWPFLFLGGVLLFGSTYWLVSAQLYAFNTVNPSVLGIPVFHIVWGAGNGIIFMYHYRDTVARKLLIVFGFSVLVFIVQYLMEKMEVIQHLAGFTDWHEFVLNLVNLSTFIFIAEAVFVSRLIRTKDSR